jgi:hypothetical protein
MIMFKGDGYGRKYMCLEMVPTEELAKEFKEAKNGVPKVSHCVTVGGTWFGLGAFWPGWQRCTDELGVYQRCRQLGV